MSKKPALSFTLVLIGRFLVLCCLLIRCNTRTHEDPSSIQNNENSIDSTKNVTIVKSIDSALVVGKIMYPSEYPPEGECRLFARTEAKVIFLTSNFTWPEGNFKVKLPLGTYDFFCTVQNKIMNSIDTGFYSNFVLTNFDSKSKDHTLIKLKIDNIKKKYEICVCDWFSQ